MLIKGVNLISFLIGIAKGILSNIIIKQISSYSEEDIKSSIEKVMIDLEKEIFKNYPKLKMGESALCKKENIEKIITWILEENIYKSDPQNFDIENFDGTVLSLEEENFIFEKLRGLISKDDILKEYIKYNMIKDTNEIARFDYEASRGRTISDKKIDNYINRKIKSLDGMNIINTNLCKICIDKKKVILLADAGMGKSEELKHLNEKVNEKDGYKSYFYDLSSYVDETIESYIQYDPDDNGISFITLDGFDEIEAQNTNTFIRRLERFIEKYEEKIIVLISSRKNFYRLSGEEFSGTLKSFAEYELLPLDKSLIEGYIEKQLECKETFKKEVSMNDLGELVKNPFYLKELIKIYKLGNTLPERINLMNKIIEIRILEDEDKFRTTKEINDRRIEIIEILERLALSLQLMGKQQISKGEYQKLLDYDQRKLIKHIGIWLKEDVVNWKFEHNNFKEYLVAKYLSGKKLEEVKKLVTYKQMPNKINQSWLNILSFMVYLNDNKELIEWLMEKDPYLIIQFEVNIADCKKRNKMIIDIFEQYKEKNISIRDDEKLKKMAECGQSKELVVFLIKEIEENLDGVGFYNAVLILQYINEFYGFEKMLRQKILDYCKDGSTGNDTKQILIKLLSNSKIYDEETVREVIEFFYDNNDTYIRTEIYKLMLTHQLQNTYIDFLKDGLEIYNSHRDGIINIGEKIYLDKNIESIDSINGIIKILDYLIEVDEKDPVDWNHNNANELFLLIKDKAELICKEGNKEILGKIKEIFIKSSLEFNRELIFLSKQFLINQEEIDNTYLLIMEDYQDEEHIANCLYEIMNSYCIDDFIERYRNGLLINKQVFIKYARIINISDYRYADIISLVFEKDNIKVPERKVIDYEYEEEKGRQIYFESLFDREKYLDLVDTFKEVNMEEGYLLDGMHKNNENKKELEYVYQDYNIYRNNTIAKLDSFIDKLETKLYWEEFSINKIIRRLTLNFERSEMKNDQKEYIKRYCYKNIKTINFESQIISQKDGGIKCDSLFRKILFLSGALSIDYDKEIYLEMLMVPTVLFDNSEKNIDNFSKYLEDNIEFKDMKNQVIFNLENKNLVGQVAIQHLNYCKKHRLEEGFGLALEIWEDSEYLESIKRGVLKYIISIKGSDYIYDELLDSSDVEQLKIINQLCLEEKNEQLAFRLRKENMESQDKRLYLGELISIDSLYGLEIYYNIALEENRIPDYSEQENNINYITELIGNTNDFDCLELLLELAKLATKNGFKDGQIFGLSSNIFKAIRNIALAGNAFKVKKKLEEFMKENNDNRLIVRFINTNIENIEVELNNQLDQNWSIEKVNSYFKNN